MKKIYLFLMVFKLTFSYINIHPTRFDKPIDNSGSYEEFTLFNQSGNTILYRVYSEKDPENPERSMERWMNFYPRTIALKPGETGKIQLSIASHGELPEGEYTAVLGVREIPIYKEEVEDNSASISVYTDLKMVLMGYAGGAKPKLRMENLKILEDGKEVRLYGAVENKGKRRGRYEIYLGERFLGRIKVMSGERLRFEDYDFSFEREEGESIPDILILTDCDTGEVVERLKI